MQPLAIIPARMNSRRVPHKNTKLLAGKPLIAWTIECALRSDVFGHVVVSTDSPVLAEIARDFGAEIPFLRPSELASDDATTLSVVQYTVDKLKSDYNYVTDNIATLQPTSPLRRPHHIQESVAAFLADASADSLVSCCEVSHSLRPDQIMRLNATGSLESAIADGIVTQHGVRNPLYARNGAAIYITRERHLKSYLLGGRILPYFMKPEDSIDIDTEFDFRRAEGEMLFRLRGGTGSDPH